MHRQRDNEVNGRKTEKCARGNVCECPVRQVRLRLRVQFLLVLFKVNIPLLKL